MDKKISISQIKEVVQQAYEQVKGNTGGKNADYIPYLANIDKNLFGISVCLLNGQTITVGDFDYRFGIESVSKVHTAILILRQYGAQKVLEMIGADATGLPFNSIIAILLENDHPSTPLVNAGAISACSMVTPIGNSDKKWDAIVQNITDLCGSAPQLIEELYKSETATNFNNRSIAWLLKNYNRIYDDPNMSLVAVDPGQMEAGRSLGLNYMTTMVVIIIPQAIRAVLPALGNEFIVLLKDTSLITTIGGKELLYAAQGIMNRTYEAMFPLLGVALIYLILVMLFTWLLSKFERRLAQSDR